MHSRLLTDLMITAIEGGSGYWCNNFLRTAGVSYDRPWYACEAFWRGGAYAATLTTTDGVEAFINPENVARGITLTEIDADNFDADDADRFLQNCCFGEVIYG